MFGSPYRSGACRRSRTRDGRAARESPIALAAVGRRRGQHRPDRGDDLAIAHHRLGSALRSEDRRDRAGEIRLRWARHQAAGA